MKDANTITEHDEVGRVAMHVCLGKTAVKQFDIATATVNVLLVLDSKLQDERLVFIAEFSELGGEAIEPGIFRSLNTCSKQHKMSNTC